MTIPDDESTPRPAGSTGPGEPTTPPPAPDAAPAAPAATPAEPVEPPAPAGQGFPAAPPPPPAYPGAAASGYPAGAPLADPTAPPRNVNIAFWLFVAGAVLSVISGIITIVAIGSQRADFLEAVRQSNRNGSANPESVADAVIAGATTWAIITLIFWAVALVLFAFFMRRGANWARIVLTVLTVLSLLNIINGYGAGFLQFALAVVGVILIWLRPSNEWFAAVKAAKAPRA
ncbi:hypothetical protein [Leifsonia shinshuensis]|uniref:hypothetical protein n=1 Tax=Leifsonia shinshuensis TaxID=150026 RepID=UPI0028601DED|nr:hypothetical protein [Leifsonia shinshuensis]MDR6972179.1 putative membrane protein [Leifsonia shinshuensis]